MVGHLVRVFDAPEVAEPQVPRLVVTAEVVEVDDLRRGSDGVFVGDVWLLGGVTVADARDPQQLLACLAHAPVEQLLGPCLVRGPSAWAAFDMARPDSDRMWERLDEVVHLADEVIAARAWRDARRSVCDGDADVPACRP